jgi:mycofactocin precursor
MDASNWEMLSGQETGMDLLHRPVQEPEEMWNAADRRQVEDVAPEQPEVLAELEIEELCVDGICGVY